MDAIYNLLARNRLEGYYKKFLDLGVKDERDFIDSVTEENLTQLGKSTEDEVVLHSWVSEDDIKLNGKSNLAFID